jgi:hypothetical protein
MQSIGYYLLHKEYEITQNFIYNKEPEYKGDAFIYSNRRSWIIIGAGNLEMNLELGLDSGSSNSN